MCAVRRINALRHCRRAFQRQSQGVRCLLHVGGGHLIGEDDLLRRGLLLHRVGIGHQLLCQLAVSAQTGTGGDQLTDDDVLLQDALALGVLSGTGKIHHMECVADDLIESVAELPAWLEGKRGENNGRN